MRAPEWPQARDEGENPTAVDPAADESENGFWSAPPRYSVVNLSFPPADAIPAPPPIRVWGARLLFGAVLCTVVTLLVFETTSWLHGATATRALAGLRR
jgi:hypothetical protein